MKKHFLSAGVASDLEEIWEFIAADSFAAADQWIAGLFELLKLLPERPAWGIG